MPDHAFPVLEPADCRPKLWATTNLSFCNSRISGFHFTVNKVTKIVFNSLFIIVITVQFNRFGIVTKLYKHYHYLIPESFFITPQRKPVPGAIIPTALAPCHPPVPEQTQIYLLSTDLPTLDISYKWKHVINGVCDRLISRGLLELIRAVAYISAAPFSHLNHTAFSSCTSWWTGTVSTVATTSKVAINICIQVFLWKIFSIHTHRGMQSLNYVVNLV